MKRTIASTKRTFTARITKPTITKTIATAARMARAAKMSFAFLSITKTSRNFGEETVTRLALAALFWQWIQQAHTGFRIVISARSRAVSMNSSVSDSIL